MSASNIRQTRWTRAVAQTRNREALLARPMWPIPRLDPGLCTLHRPDWTPAHGLEGV